MKDGLNKLKQFLDDFENSQTIKLNTLNKYIFTCGLYKFKIVLIKLKSGYGIHILLLSGCSEYNMCGWYKHSSHLDENEMLVVMKLFSKTPIFKSENALMRASILSTVISSGSKY